MSIGVSLLGSVQRTTHVCSAGGKKKGKNKPQYGSGRDAMPSSLPTELHFGRLIGETAKDTAQKLEQRSSMASTSRTEDVRAKLYLEKWEQEEDASYEMFESTSWSHAGVLHALTLSLTRVALAHLLILSPGLLNGKPLDERAKKIKDLEFASIMEMSTDDEVLQEFEAVALSSGDERDGEIGEKDDKTKGEPERGVPPPPSYDAFAALLDPAAAKSSNETEQVEVAEKMKEAKEVSEMTVAAAAQGQPLTMTEASADDDRKATKRQKNIARAKALLSKNAFVEASIWKANRAGLLIDADHVTGFLPFKELTAELKQKVRNAQDKAAIHFQENGERAREAGMNVLMGTTLSVRVVSVDDETERVVFSMDKTSSGAARNTNTNKNTNSSDVISQEVLQQAGALVGSILPVTVANVTDFGVFCRFEVNGVDLVGLVYRTEISWLEDGDKAMKGVSVGENRTAKIVHVDQNKAHVFLSFKRTTPNPLLETLDTLMLSGGEKAASSAGTGRETVESIDLRPLLGDMQDAVAIANRLRQSGFHKVTLGARLNSKATSQAVEVYLSKPKPTDGEQTTMIVRRGDAVQEIIVGSSDRQRIKSVVSMLQLSS